MQGGQQAAVAALVLAAAELQAALRHMWPVLLNRLCLGVWVPTGTMLGYRDGFTRGKAVGRQVLSTWAQLGRHVGPNV
jgi:hypothetical protein